MQVLYVTLSYQFTSGVYPGSPSDPQFNINGQQFYLADDAYQPAVLADPIADYTNYPEDWQQGVYLENSPGSIDPGSPLAGYWTLTITGMSFTKPPDFDSQPQVPDGNGNTGNKYDVAVVPDNFQIPTFISTFPYDFPNQPGLTIEAATHSAALHAGGTNEFDVYNHGVLVTSFIASSNINTTTLMPIGDGNGGTEIVVDPAQVQPSNPQFSPSAIGTNGTIAWSFIQLREAGNWLNPYWPGAASGGDGRNRCRSLRGADPKRNFHHF